MAGSGTAGRAALLLFVSTAVSQWHMSRLLRPVAADMGRLQLTTDPQEMRRIITGWDERQRACYRSHLRPDMLHPFLYGSAFIAAGRAGSTSATPRWLSRLLVLAPVAAAACDLAENAFQLRFTDDPASITDEAATASARFTRAKWVLLLGSAGLLAARALLRDRPRPVRLRISGAAPSSRSGRGRRSLESRCHRPVAG